MQGKPFITYVSQFIKTEPLAKLLNKARAGAGINSEDFVLAGNKTGQCKITIIPLDDREAGKTLVVTFSIKTKGLEK